MQRSSRWIVRVVAVMLVLFVPEAGFAETPQTPQAIVEKYCSLDAQGGNFSSSNPNFRAIGELLINEDEAAYDSSVVIRSYRIRRLKISLDSADVEVLYADLGMVSGGELKKKRRSELVIFHLTKVGSDWKIDGLRIFPHVSKAWLLSEFSKGLTSVQARDSKSIKELSQW